MSESILYPSLLGSSDGQIPAAIEITAFGSYSFPTNAIGVIVIPYGTFGSTTDETYSTLIYTVDLSTGSVTLAVGGWSMKFSTSDGQVTIAQDPLTKTIQTTKVFMIPICSR